MTDQEDHSAAKRQQIIRGAGLVFTDCGYEGASMSRIAAEAGVSKGTLYNYFDSKSVLFAVFVEHMVSGNLANIFQQAYDGDDVITSLHAIALRMLDTIISPASLLLYRIVVSEAKKFPQLATVYWKSGHCQATEYMQRWIEMQVSEGRLAVPDPKFAAEQFLALCQTRVGAQRRLQITQDTPTEEIEQVVDGAVRLFLKGYGIETAGMRSGTPLPERQ